jgi:hypothetical protein
VEYSRPNHAKTGSLKFNFLNSYPHCLDLVSLCSHIKMTALYLHNTLFAPESSPPPQHSHYRSSSSATLQTDQTHTTEPLLHRERLEEATSGAATYQDHLSRRALSSESTYAASRAAWETGMPNDAERTVPGYWEKRALRRRTLRLRAVLVVSNILMGEWRNHFLFRAALNS